MPRWAVVLEGSYDDLRDWADALGLGFDPYVEVRDGNYMLHTAAFDDLTTAEAVHTEASKIIHVLRGAIAATGSRTTVSSGSVVEYRPDGTCARHVVVALGAVAAQGRAAGVGVALGPDGTVIPPTPRPSQVQQWIAVAAKDRHLADALAFFGGAQDWFDVYNTLESLEERFGDLHALLPPNYASKREVDLMWRTANWPRHAPTAVSALEQPMALHRARGLVSQLLVQAFQRVSQHPPQPPKRKRRRGS